MRKKILLFLGMICGACFAVAPVCLASSAAGSDLSSDSFTDNNWWLTENIKWNKTELYEMETVFEEMPKSFETWIQIDPNYTAKGGVIFGNIDANKRPSSSSYTNVSTNAISFQIDQLGRPMLYHKDDSGEIVSAIFNNVDVRSNDFVHLAITRSADTAYCYLNGELKESASFVIDDFISAYPFAVGNDYREARGEYFKGQIKSLAVFSDERTGEEIASDKERVDLTDNDLMVAYNLERMNGADNIEDLSKNDNDLVRTWLLADKIVEDDYDYSMMVLGDTQALLYYRQCQDTAEPDSFNRLYDYIVDNAEKEKVEHIFHLGDITQKAGLSSNASDEFDYVKSNYAKLDALYEETGITYSVIGGNHDFSDGKATKYIETFGGEENAYSKQYFASSDPETALTTAHKFSVGELDYLLVNISFWATADDIAWADELIAAHPYHNVIISTHAYVNQNGNLSGLTSYNVDESAGDYHWIKGVDALVRKHENVVLTLNGHTPTTQVESFTIYGDHGNKVTQMVIDPTYYDGESSSISIPHIGKQGAGLIAYLRFSDGGKKVSVSWYSAIREQYYNSKSVYTVELATIARQQPGELGLKVKGVGGSATASSTALTGEPITVTFIPEPNYYLSKVTLNGNDITKQVVDNVYTLTGAEDGTVIVAEFALTKYPVTIRNDNEKGRILFLTDASTFAQGVTVRFTVTSRSGWKTVKVCFNGEELTRNERGEYSLTITETENILSVEYEEVVVQPEQVRELSFFEKIIEFFNGIFQSISSFFSTLFGKK